MKNKERGRKEIEECEEEYEKQKERNDVEGEYDDDIRE